MSNHEFNGCLCESFRLSDINYVFRDSISISTANVLYPFKWYISPFKTVHDAQINVTYLFCERSTKKWLYYADYAHKLWDYKIFTFGRAKDKKNGRSFICTKKWSIHWIVRPQMPWESIGFSAAGVQANSNFQTIWCKEVALSYLQTK